MSYKNKDINKRRSTTAVKTAKGRRISSTHWLQRQLNDPYVALSKQEGYRSRAAYKLLEIDQKFQILKPGYIVVDLGAAPGGWSQVTLDKVISHKKEQTVGLVIAIDLIPLEPIENLITIEGDFTKQETQNILNTHLHQKANVILSDMAAPASGYPDIDHIRIINLCETALEFAHSHLIEGGYFVTKLFAGKEEQKFIKMLQKHFQSVKRFKPPASRAESSEFYIIAQGFRI
ncbi:Ribosomal RNA large subunit methyltransferase E [Rickettsiales bacterium Ac37b]|nr:Ribosomal RNA large subunit methyltransferase E [Rickettsiales bacterium Ac37b]